MDTYQPIYDAVQAALRDAHLGDYASMAGNAVIDAAGEYNRPSAVWRPKLSIDGDHWCALYGDNLQDGVAGFGKSPEVAMRAFDVAWYQAL